MEKLKTKKKKIIFWKQTQLQIILFLFFGNSATH